MYGVEDPQRGVCVWGIHQGVGVNTPCESKHPLRGIKLLLYRKQKIDRRVDSQFS